MTRTFLLIRSLINLCASAGIDLVRFAAASHLANPFKNKKTAQAHILRVSHALEKGMSMPSPRTGFGQSKAAELAEFLNKYIARHGLDTEAELGISAITSLISFHKSRGVDVGQIERKVSALFSANHLDSAGRKAGIKRVTKSEILNSLPSSPEDFFFNRHSIRQFDPHQSVEEAAILRAVQLAQKSPSVCNRQSARVYVFPKGVQADKVLAHQDGNAGFGNLASSVLIITTDLSAFYKPGERNQGYIDGGIYAASIVYALHSIGLGTCMLNWSQAAKKDLALRRAIGMAREEAIITMIAVGSLPAELDVAASPRRKAESITRLARNESI